MIISVCSFFANKKYNVIAFEPVTSFYELDLKNLILNPILAIIITIIIILVNKAISDKNEIIKINYNDLGDSAASSFGVGSFECEIETLTIQNIINDYNIKNPYLLKIDCKCCKNPMILNSNLFML